MRSQHVLVALLVALVTAGQVGTGRAESHRVTLEGAVELALQRSNAAERQVLGARRHQLTHASARRSLWPDLQIHLRAPLLSQEFDVEALPGSSVDTVLTDPGDTLFVSQQIFGKTTTTRKNASGDLLLRQLLPWRGSLEAGGSVFYRDESTDPAGIRQSRRDYQVHAQVGLQMQLLGDDRERRQLKRAGIEHEMAIVREAAENSQLIFEASSRYLALLRSSLSLEIVRGALELSTHAHEQAGRKVAAGLLPEVEHLRLGVHRAEREVSLADAETRFARESDAFKVFLGLPPTDSLILQEVLQPFEIDVALDGAVQMAKARRAEIGLARRELLLLELDRRARRPYVPDVSFSLRYGGAASESALDRALEALSANTISFQMLLSMPLWDSGRQGLEEEWERLGIRLRELELREAESAIELEVRDALRQLEDAKRRRQLYEASAALAEETLRISSERFERGLIDIDAYLNAQAEAAGARLGRTGALLDLYQARARLRLVTLNEDL